MDEETEKLIKINGTFVLRIILLVGSIRDAEPISLPKMSVWDASYWNS